MGDILVRSEDQHLLAGGFHVANLVESFSLGAGESGGGTAQPRFIRAVMQIDSPDRRRSDEDRESIVGGFFRRRV